MMENASLFLAGVDGIDVVFTGHQHLVFPNSKDFKGITGADLDKGTLMGKPAVMAGFWGSHMGLIDLLLEKDGDGWKIVSHTSEARPIWTRDATTKKVVPTVAGRRRRRGPGRSRPQGDARLCPPPGRPDRRAALLLLLAGRRRSVGADRLDRPDLVHQGKPQGHAVGEPAAALGRGAVQGRRQAAARTTTPTCRSARWRSRTSPTSTSIPTPSAPWKSPARRCANGSSARPASSTRSRPAARTPT